MRKITLIAFSGLILLISGTPLNAQSGKYRIEGTIDRSFDGQRAILTVTNEFDNFTFSDTSVIEQGRFVFEGDEYLEYFSHIAIKDRYSIQAFPALTLMLESGAVSVTYSDSLLYATGTPLNDIYTKSLKLRRDMVSEIFKLSDKWIIPGGYSFNESPESKKLFYDLGEYMINFFRENYSNPLGKAGIKELAAKGRRVGFLDAPTVTYFENSESSIDDIFGFVDSDIKEHPVFIAYLKRMKEFTDKTPSPLIGKQLDNFTLSTPAGAAKQLSDYIGKKDYVFLEFWASWCGPCIASIPELKEIYAEHSDKLEIVSISLDTNQKSWTDAMKAQNMPWPQLADLKAFDSDIVKWFEIKGIPFGVLVDKDGVIVDQSGAAGLKFYMQSK